MLLYRVYEGFKLNIGKRSEMIISGSLLTTFKIGSIFLRQLGQCRTKGYNSDSKPGCCGIQGCRKELSGGVLHNNEFYYSFIT